MSNPKEEFFNDPKDFFERYSINLPGNPEEAGKIGGLELIMSTLNPIKPHESNKGANASESNAGKSFHKFKKTATSVHVSSLAHNAAWQIDESQKKATLIVRNAATSITRTQEDSENLKWFLCLMLPWVENGATSMQIRKDTRANAFFTGQMNGCSFVVTGDPEEPFVSHINCNNAEEYEDVYQNILDIPHVNKNGATRLGRETYKLNDIGKNTHERLIEEQLALQNRKLASPIITDTLCFVMGRRVEKKWEFFYQRVITQKYNFKDKLGWTGGATKFFRLDNRQLQTNVIYRSLSSYTKLWPDGPGQLSI